MSLELLLIIAFGGPIVTYFLGKLSSGLRGSLAVLNATALVAATACLYGQTIEKPFYLGFLNLPFVLRMDMLSPIIFLLNNR